MPHSRTGARGGKKARGSSLDNDKGTVWTRKCAYLCLRSCTLELNGSDGSVSASPTSSSLILSSTNAARPDVSQSDSEVERSPAFETDVAA